MSPSELNRRAILAGIATVAIATPGALAFASPTATPSAATEDANLLALGERIDPLLSAYRAAVQRRREARAIAEKLCPQMPDELVQKPEDRIDGADITRREIDIEDAPVHAQNFVGVDGRIYARRDREIIQSELLEKAFANGDLPGPRTRWARGRQAEQLRKKLAIAKKYESERDSAIATSGIREACDQLRSAADEIELLAYEVRKIESATMVGVLIQARALSAYHEAELDCGSGWAGRSGSVLGRELAASVLRIAAGGSRGVS